MFPWVRATKMGCSIIWIMYNIHVALRSTTADLRSLGAGRGGGEVRGLNGLKKCGWEGVDPHIQGRNPLRCSLCKKWQKIAVIFP